MRWTRPLIKGLGIALVSILFISVKAAPPQQDKPIKTIVIDAGHGGHDSGAKGSYSSEKDISLAVALKLGKLIEERMPDVKVVYTRKTDRFDDPREKARIANEANGDLFISIHCNAAYARKVVGYRKGKSKKKIPIYKNVPSAAKGTETYVWATSKNAAKTESLRNMNVIVLDANSEESKQVMGDNDIASVIMRRTMSNVFFDNSLRLSNLIEDEFTQTGRISRGSRQRDEKGIWVLQATAMPSVLVELGFISNPDEEDYLNSAAGQNEAANSIFKATKRYKDYLEKYGAQSDAANDPAPAPAPPPPATVEKQVQPAAVKAEMPAANNAEEYRVQLCITDKVYTENATIFKKLGTSKIEREQVLIDKKKKYKYLMGAYRTEAEAHAAMYKAQKQGFPDAFVVPYKNGCG
ncbi:N-acetylmuramoyl-L-alanine amidase [Chitinophaga sedimenti]|uniref:N-acetylmuramoyl-L-alanine amidase family protein n=1 Tax=Chitinophaga sedimenti TaxID=2033606 RepID=UPI0020064F49|nr:N-acetylmuramoyl-L-alanine amidase [Chitinophaga sedimenti]MCK7553926.1 N-acetylmuramoyl-L-alanine amidase [Chitinophaga sedimenti]